MTITVELIHATADELYSQGIKPTQISVRKALGKGSFSTISEALRIWRAEQETVAELAQVVLPQEIAERADILVAQLWDTAQSIANDKLIEEREALATARTNMDMEMADMAEVVATLESEQADMAEQVERLEAKIKELQAQRDGLQSELAQSRTECTHLSDKLTDREKHTEELEKRVGELTGENKGMIAEIARLTSRNQFKNDEIKRLEAELDKTALLHQAQSEVAKKELEAVRAELSEVVKDNAKLQGKLELSADNQAKADKTIESQVDKIAELTVMIAELKAADKTAERPARVKTTKKPTAKAE